MAFRDFRLNLVLRIVLIAATLLSLIVLLLQTTYYATAAVAFLLFCAQMIALIRFVERTNEEVRRFLQSVRYGDFSATFTQGKRDRMESELRSTFNEVMDQFRRTRHQAEEQAQYLQTVVQHIGVGLLSFEANGDVGLINTAAKRLLRVNHLTNVRALAGLGGNVDQGLLALRSGDRQLLRIEQDNETLQIAVSATELRVGERHYTLVSLQNIRNELEEKEMDAWQNLIRVLTHEIMNSITPISSLASTANDLVQSATAAGGEGLVGETAEDVRGALQTIKKRSEGLLHFVDAYRNLAHIPRPKFKLIGVTELFGRMELLMKSQLSAKSITLTMSSEPESLELLADPELIEQVFLNLLVNAAQALEGQEGGTICVNASLDKRGRVIVDVEDNGPGISAEALDKIFVPFFTTKKEGSGIGLSLSRQIMRLHKGTLSVRSEPHKRTVFTMQF